MRIPATFRTSISLFILASFLEGRLPAAPLFDSAMAFEGGMYPITVEACDLNGDSNQDLVTANFERVDDKFHISIMLGMEDGQLADPVSYETIFNSTCAIAAHIDEDAYLDIVVSSRQSDEIGVHRGVGDGTFLPVSVFNVPGDHNAVVSSDFDGDSFADLAMTREVDGELDGVSILFGNGKGEFTKPLNIDTGNRPLCLMAANLDEDPRPDLAVTNLYSDTVTILRGIGDRQFTHVNHFNAGDAPYGLCAAQLNSDSYPDLAITNINGGTFSVLPGSIDSSFGPPVPFPVGEQPTDIEAGFLDADGTMDLVISNNRSLTLSAVMGFGDGTFGPPTDYSTQGNPTSLELVDLDGDLRLDMAATNLSCGQISVHFGAGDGTFHEKLTYIVHGFSPNGLAVGNFDGDAFPDVVIATNEEGLQFLKGNGDCSLGEPVSTSSDLKSFLLNLVPSDFNGDSKLDLACAGLGPSVQVMLGNGDGTFGDPVAHALPGSSSLLAAAQLDPGNTPDLVIVLPELGSVLILLGDGDGTFTTGNSYFVNSHPGRFVLEDLNADTKPDIAVVHEAWDNFSVLLGNGDGTFSDRVRSYITGDNPRGIATGMFNDDSILDLAISNFSDISIHMGNGDGSFGGPIAHPVYYTTGNLVSADLDGDSKTDLAAPRSFSLPNSSDLCVFTGNGDATFQPHGSFSMLDENRYLLPYDLDGDELPELVSLGYFQSHAYVVVQRNISGIPAPTPNVSAWVVR